MQNQAVSQTPKTMDEGSISTATKSEAHEPVKEIKQGFQPAQQSSQVHSQRVHTIDRVQQPQVFQNSSHPQASTQPQYQAQQTFQQPQTRNFHFGVKVFQSVPLCVEKNMCHFLRTTSESCGTCGQIRLITNNNKICKKRRGRNNTCYQSQYGERK